MAGISWRHQYQRMQRTAAQRGAIGGGNSSLA